MTEDRRIATAKASILRQMIDAYALADQESCGNGDKDVFLAGALVVINSLREIFAMTDLPMDVLLNCAERAATTAFDKDCPPQEPVATKEPTP